MSYWDSPVLVLNWQSWEGPDGCWSICHDALDCFFDVPEDANRCQFRIHDSSFGLEEGEIVCVKPSIITDDSGEEIVTLCADDAFYVVDEDMAEVLRPYLEKFLYVEMFDWKEEENQKLAAQEE